MKVETQLEFKNYLRLMYFIMYRKPATILLTIIGWIMFICSLLYFFGIYTFIDEPPYFLLVFGFFATIMFPFFIYMSSKKSFYSAGQLQEKMIYEFTNDQIRIIGETFSMEMDWSKIYRILELKKWILIFYSNQAANIISKSSFGDNLDEFRSLVRSKNIKAKLK